MSWIQTCLEKQHFAVLRMKKAQDELRQAIKGYTQRENITIKEFANRLNEPLRQRKIEHNSLFVKSSFISRFLDGKCLITDKNKLHRVTKLIDRQDLEDLINKTRVYFKLSSSYNNQNINFEYNLSSRSLSLTMYSESVIDLVFDIKKAFNEVPEIKIRRWGGPNLKEKVQLFEPLSEIVFNACWERKKGLKLLENPDTVASVRRVIDSIKWGSINTLEKLETTRPLLTQSVR